MNAAPLLSIIIPTKDRYETLMPVLRALTGSIRDDRLEIVVQDNSAQPLGEESFHREVGDQRVRYRHVGEKLSIVANTVQAIEHSRGMFLIFIGDDDLVSPYVMDFVDWMKANACEALAYGAARYWWGSVQFEKPTKYHHAGAFWLMEPHDGRLRRMETKRELNRILALGGVNYGEMPRFYHGIVSRNALERIRSDSGVYVPGASPDMAFSAALCLVMDEYTWVDYPVSVFGAARNSGGGMTAARRHHGRLEDQAHLPRQTIEQWNPLLPRIWSELTIYPQTLGEVGCRFNRDLSVDYDAFYAAALVTEPHIWPYLPPCLKAHYTSEPARLPRLLALLVKKLLGRAWRAAKASQQGLMNCELHRFESIGAVADFLASERFRPHLPATTAERRL